MTGGRRIHVVAGVLADSSGRVLIAKRAANVHQGGLWEFPGGKLEDGEAPLDGLNRELREELGVDLQSARPLIQVEHDYGDRCVVLDVYLVDRYRGEARGLEGQPLAWRFPATLEADEFPPADVPVLTALKLPSLCLITPDDAPNPLDPAQSDRTQSFIARIAAALAGGVGMVQLRAHRLSGAAYAALAKELASLCQDYGAHLVLNREPSSLPQVVGSGLHLSSVALSRLSKGPRCSAGFIGASCHNEQELAAAVHFGLDYAFLSPVKQTLTHPGANPLGWDGFHRMIRSLPLPVYALGGLTTADLPAAWQHGAQGIAAIRAFDW